MRPAVRFDTVDAVEDGAEETPLSLGRCGVVGPGRWDVVGSQPVIVGAGRHGQQWPAAVGRQWPAGRSRRRVRPRAERRAGFRSRGGHGWGSMRDCGRNRKDEMRIGVESLTSAVYASALRALCVLERGVSAFRAGSGPREPLAGVSPTTRILLSPVLAVRVV